MNQRNSCIQAMAIIVCLLLVSVRQKIKKTKLSTLVQKHDIQKEVTKRCNAKFVRSGLVSCSIFCRLVSR